MSQISISTLFVLISSRFIICCCFNKINEAANWSSGVATWYGPPNGAGTDGGACGYSDAVSKNPYNSMVSAGGPSLFKSGEGCGECYQVKCTENSACSGSPVNVTIIDECPGCTEAIHFDLSGSAMAAMAIPHQEDQLRNAGVLQILYRRINCNYSNTNLVFHVDSGSTPFFFAMAVENEDGDGDLGAIELQQNGTTTWTPMQRLWGDVWKLNSQSPLNPPFSFRLTTETTKQTLVVDKVIPVGWQPGTSYQSNVNFLIN